MWWIGLLGWVSIGYLFAAWRHVVLNWRKAFMYGGIAALLYAITARLLHG